MGAEHLGQAWSSQNLFRESYVRFARKSSFRTDADDATLEQYQAEMQAALDRITAFAEAQFPTTRN